MKGTTMVDSHELSATQCESLLRGDVAGRIAVTTPDGPFVVPVNYRVVDDAIIIRTTPESVLGTYGRGTIVGFQIDAFDRARQRGWSVYARGPSEVVTDPDELIRLRAYADPGPWASGSRTLYLRLRWNELTGRQLGRHWGPLEGVPRQESH